MKLIVGLGNPGNEYADTRHNLGFRVADALRERWDLAPFQEKFASHFTKGAAGAQQVVLLEPQTYMNASGDAVIDVIQFYKIDPAADLVVIHDEIDLPLGTIRVQRDISAAGHNGVKSVIERIGRQDFTRVRVGTGRPTDQTPVDDFVLRKFPEEEKAAAEEAVKKAADEIEKLLQ